ALPGSDGDLLGDVDPCSCVGGLLGAGEHVESAGGGGEAVGGGEAEGLLPVAEVVHGDVLGDALAGVERVLDGGALVAAGAVGRRHRPAGVRALLVAVRPGTGRAGGGEEQEQREQGRGREHARTGPRERRPARRGSPRRHGCSSPLLCWPRCAGRRRVDAMPQPAAAARSASRYAGSTPQNSASISESVSVELYEPASTSSGEFKVRSAV